MSSDPVYDPNSFNALASRILERLDQQDVATADHRQEIKTQISTFQGELLNVSGRVTGLEEGAWKQRGFVAAIALAVPSIWQWVSTKTN